MIVAKLMMVVCVCVHVQGSETTLLNVTLASNGVPGGVGEGSVCRLVNQSAMIIIVDKKSSVFSLVLRFNGVSC